MLLLSRVRLLVGLVLFVMVLALSGSSRAQGAKNTKNIDFKTYDGVTIQGTFYPNASGKRDAVVMLLHDIDLKKGGSSQQEGWSDLAAALQEAGYPVLTFDFRGFGESKEVNPDEFWKESQNTNLVRGGVKKPSQIDHKNFNPRYIPYLVNDIAAAKAYLDRQNDQKACNTSSLIVIGAGEGATLGSLWLAHEARRRKDKNPASPLLLAVPPQLGEPEVNNVAAAIWLSISPRLGGVQVPVGSLMREVGRDHKVPMAFVYGKGDGTGDNFARSLMNMINPRGSKDKDFQLTNIMPIPDTKLAGHKLLGKGSETEAFVVKKYLPSVMEKRGNKEWSERKVEASAYWYTQAKTNKPFRINKKPNELAPAVSLNLFLQGF
ncbi:MAG: hypothetical protein U0840_09920 [Gemmataceae bacterium]